MGFVVLALGFFVFGGSGYFASPDGKVSLWWMIARLRTQLASVSS